MGRVETVPAVASVPRHGVSHASCTQCLSQVVEVMAAMIFTGRPAVGLLEPLLLVPLLLVLWPLTQIAALLKIPGVTQIE